MRGIKKLDAARTFLHASEKKQNSSWRGMLPHAAPKSYCSCCGRHWNHIFCLETVIGASWGYPHHLGQHQTHHFRQHPEITHSSHFGRSLWATRISSLWATRTTSFLSSNYLTQPFRGWVGWVGGGEGSFFLHHYLTQPFRVWLGRWGGIILLTSLLDSAIQGLVGGVGEGSFFLHHYLTQPFRV